MHVWRAQKRQPEFSLFRMPYVNGLRREPGALRGSLRGGATELELDLIQLIDDLAHDCLIRVGRSSEVLALVGRSRPAKLQAVS